VFGGLSVILYKPWRRRIDKRRVRNAHFEALAQEPAPARTEEEELYTPSVLNKDNIKNSNVNILPVEATDVAGPVNG
jgi:high-affinity nickel-transport protein